MEDLEPSARRVLARGAAVIRRDVASITEESIARAVKEIESYRTIPVADLRASVHRNVMRTAQVLEEAEVPDPGAVTEAMDTTAQRAAQEIPIEDVMRGYRLSISIIFEHFNAWAVRERVEPDRVLAGARLLWRVGDLYISQAAVAYQRIVVENAVSADRARTAFIKEILSGSVGTPVPAEHGLSPTTPYRALVAEPMRDVDHQVLRRQLESSGQAGAHPALTCVVDERIIGLTPRVPHAAGTGIVSLGPPVEAARAAASMEVAELVHGVVAPRRSAGVHTLEDVTWRAAARSVPLVNAWLRERYLAPIRREGRAGRELEETLVAFLENRRHVGATAEALLVHPNTLRYRLNRIKSLLDVDLESTDVIVGLSWALETASDE